MKTAEGEPMYCAQQIVIPPDLPDILKTFTKAIIRANPKDVLRWSAEYFNRESGLKLDLPDDPEGFTLDAPAGGDDPRITQEAATRLFQAFSRDFSSSDTARMADLVKVAQQEANLPDDVSTRFLAVGDWSHESGVDWINFLALVVSSFNSDVKKTMQTMCSVSGYTIDKSAFIKAYRFLGSIDGKDDISDVIAEVEASSGVCEDWCKLLR